MPDALETLHPRFSRDRWPERLAGQAVRSVDAHGKHLFLRFEGGLTIHSHLRMTGSWRVLDADRRPSAARPGSRSAATTRPSCSSRDPVLELMTDSRTRIDQRIAGLGPDILAPEFDYDALPPPPARGRPDAPDRRRRARAEDRRGHRQPVEGGGVLGRADRPVAAHRRRLRRGGGRDRRRRPPAHAGVGPRRLHHAQPAGLQPRRPPVPALRHADRGSAASGTTTARPSGAPDVSAEARRPQGRRPDRARQHARVVRRRAGGRRRHDRVRRPPRPLAGRGRHAADPRPRLRARDRATR